ncbi:TonB-dependent siderophore receptor [Paraferrimonas sp. SM1919]|uniref:TonB-dependent receptor plug domain-containing protein n=1 Tax=Paraferrimonas sp. SM1919 TaxID=2662263 RepID=UPI0013D59AB9|nr:TonB-dependent receptor [Paraferrimonas sp. SM1919]
MNMKYLYAALLAASGQTMATDDVERITITGSNLPYASASAKDIVEIISYQQIKASNSRSLVELLNQFNGVHIALQGSAGGTSNLYLQGAEPNYTSIMLDGVQLNDPTNTQGGAVDLNSINLNNIDRIEIIKGASSAIYGSGSMAGIINIITQAGPQHDSSVMVNLGSSDYHSQGLKLNTGNKNHHFGLNFSNSHSGEAVAGFSQQQRSVHAKYHHYWSAAKLITASVNYQDSQGNAYPEDSGGPELALSDKLDVKQQTRWSYAVNADLALTDHYQLQLKAEHLKLNEQHDSPGIAPYNQVPANGTDNQFSRSRWMMNHQLNWQALAVSAGLDYQNENANAQGYVDFGMLIPTDFNLNRDQVGAFIESRYDGANSYVAASIRQDRVAAFNHNSYQIQWGFDLSDSVSLKINSASGFKMPSFFALGHGLTGNANLQPEYAKTHNLSLSYIDKKLSLNATAYFRDFTNLIDFDSHNFTHVNRANIKISGIEMSASAPLLDVLTLAINGFYNQTDLAGSDTPLRGRPNNKLNVNLDYAVNDNLDLTMDYAWVGKSYQSSLVTGMVELTNYQILNSQLSWQLAPNYDLIGSVSNILNEQYYQAVGTPSAGRQFFVKFVFSW